MSRTASLARWIDARPAPALAVGVGTVGAVGTVLWGSLIGSVPRPPGYRWWLRLPHESYSTAHVWFYLSVALLTLGWIWFGLLARRGRATVAHCWTALALWGAPLLVGAPLFGRDVYSYIAQGELARRGLNPYTSAPSALGHGVVLSSIAWVWQNTTSPYGPLFVMLTRLTVAIAGPSLMAQVIAFRLLGSIGVVTLMICLPALARHFGVTPAVALWLGVLSPLALFSAISSSHNDTLMIALMAVALVLSVRGHRRGALVLLALAATIKLPALAGAVVISAAAWPGASWRQRARLVTEALVLPTVVIVVVTVLCGDGWTWLGPTALKIPTELHVLTTPVVSVGVLLATLLHALGATAARRTVVTWTQHGAEVAALAVLAGLVVRVRPTNVVRLLGVSLLVVVVASPTTWPWYFLWGLVALAVTTAQRSVSLATVAGGAMLLVGPSGTPMIGGNGFYVTGPLLAAGLGWICWRGHWRRAIEGIDHA